MKYLLLLPAVAFFLVFTAWPLADLLRMSMLKTNFIVERYIGFDNYVQSLRSAAFLRSIGNSLIYMAILVPVQTIGALVIALSASKMGKGWQDATRIILYLPALTAGIIIAQVWRWIFHIDGPINWVLSKIGIGEVNWFGQGATAIPALSMILVMSSMGGYVIMFMAGILSIDKSIFDAAMIDGASPSQISRHIVIPIIAPMMLLVVQLIMIAALQIFEYIYMLAPYEHSASVSYSIYQQSFQFSKWGMAAAQAVILALVIAGLSLTRRAVKA